MPVTTVQKIISVMIMVISRMKASPSGFMATARAGLSAPKMIAAVIPTVTCTHNEEYQRRIFGDGGAAMVGVVMSRLVSSPGGLPSAIAGQPKAAISTSGISISPAPAAFLPATG